VGHVGRMGQINAKKGGDQMSDDYIQMSQNRDQCRPLVNTVKTLWVP